MIVVKVIFSCLYCDAVYIWKMDADIGAHITYLSTGHFAECLPDDWHMLKEGQIVCGDHDITIRGNKFYVKRVAV